MRGSILTVLKISQTIFQIVELKNDDFEQKTDDELIELAVKEYEENLSFIDDIVEEKFKFSSN